MEYMLAADQPFQEIESQTVSALERGGFVVRRTFSLGSATGAGRDRNPGNPDYAVLMLYASGDQLRFLGLVTLHEREGRIVLRSLPGSPSRDGEADLVAALTLGDLDFCVQAMSGKACIEPEGQL